MYRIEFSRNIFLLSYSPLPTFLRPADSICSPPMQVAKSQAKADNGHSGVVVFWRLTINFFNFDCWRLFSGNLVQEFK